MTVPAFGQAQQISLKMNDSEVAAVRSVLELLYSVSKSSADFSTLPNLATRILDARRSRRHFFNTALFSDPAWDMLLTLYVSGCRGEEISVTSLIFSIDLAQTTGLRWIQVLEKEGLVARQQSSTDGRRVFLRLTAEAKDKMEAFLTREIVHF